MKHSCAQFGDFRQRGFTLVELVATVAILGTISAVLASLIYTSFGGYVDASVRGQLQTEGSIALDRIVRTMRAIELDTSATGVAPDIDSIQSGSITWGGNNTITLTGNQLTMALNGGTPAVLADDVISFQIAALDESNTTLTLPLSGAACDPVRRLRFEITLSRQNQTALLRTKAFLRSTMSGG